MSTFIQAALSMVLCCVLLAPLAAATEETGAEGPWELVSGLAAEDAYRVSASLEVGGELEVQQEEGQKKLPLSVAAELGYDELVTHADAGGHRRALRRYDTAKATIKVGGAAEERTLDETQRVMMADLAEGHFHLNRGECPAQPARVGPS